MRYTKTTDTAFTSSDDKPADNSQYCSNSSSSSSTSSSTTTSTTSSGTASAAATYCRAAVDVPQLPLTRQAVLIENERILTEERRLRLAERYANARPFLDDQGRMLGEILDPELLADSSDDEDMVLTM